MGIIGRLLVYKSTTITIFIKHFTLGNYCYIKRWVKLVVPTGGPLTSLSTLAIKGGDPINSQSIKGASSYKVRLTNYLAGEG